MHRSLSRAIAATSIAAGVVLAAGTAALAVSGGGYAPSQQDCRPSADAWSTPSGQTEKGCHDTAVNVEDGKGNRYAEVGLDQLPDGGPAGTPTPYSLGYPGNDNSPHSGCLAANTNGTGGGTGPGCGNNPKGAGFSATWDYENQKTPLSVTPDTGTPDLVGLFSNLAKSGVHEYFGMDDNSDAGEHDGVSGTNGTAGSINGPSDGGGLFIVVEPQNAAVVPSFTDPVPVAGAGEGSCADGICQETTTRQQTIYQGCSPTGNHTPDVKCSKGQANSSRDVYNYQGKTFPPPTCNSGDATSQSPQSCDGHPMDYYRQIEAHSVNAEPGVQTYEDPDPQASPAAPFLTPGIYAGSCGVVAGGGPLPAAPASPVTNKAGQVVISTGC